MAAIRQAGTSTRHGRQRPESRYQLASRHRSVRSATTPPRGLDSTFNHTTTGFALTGTHATTPCAQCHVNNNYSLTSANTDCMGCHLSAWNSTQTLGGNVPNHVAANFPTTAAACSRATHHHLGGRHVQPQHHRLPAYEFASDGSGGKGHRLHAVPRRRQLYAEHSADGLRQCRLPPDHLAADQQSDAFRRRGPLFAAANCSTCHDTITWTDSTFNHADRFALTGAHATTACALCHVNNNYNLTSANTDCYGCHQTAWTSTQTLGGAACRTTWPRISRLRCAPTCHDTIAWADGKFDHSTTGWALTGGQPDGPRPRAGSSRRAPIAT